MWERYVKRFQTLQVQYFKIKKFRQKIYVTIYKKIYEVVENNKKPIELSKANKKFR